MFVWKASRTNQVRDNASAADTLDGMLSRLGLLLAVNKRDVGYMDVDEVALASLVLELGQSLDERHALDITNRTALESKC